MCKKEMRMLELGHQLFFTLNWAEMYLVWCDVNGADGQLFFPPFLFSVFLGQTVFFDCLLLIFHFYLAEMKLVWCEVNGVGGQLPPGTIDGLFYHLEAHHPLHCAKPHFHLVDFLKLLIIFLLFFLFQTKHSLWPIANKKEPTYHHPLQFAKPHFHLVDFSYTFIFVGYFLLLAQLFLSSYQPHQTERPYRLIWGEERISVHLFLNGNSNEFNNTLWHTRLNVFFTDVSLLMLSAITCLMVLRILGQWQPLSWSLWKYSGHNRILHIRYFHLLDLDLVWQLPLFKFWKLARRGRLLLCADTSLLFPLYFYSVMVVLYISSTSLLYWHSIYFSFL